MAPTPSAQPAAKRWRHRLVLVVLGGVLPAGAALLYHYPPTEASFYPRCFLHQLTGLYCPGCGATRCFAALVHGDVAQAFAYNPLLVVALPLLAVGVVEVALRAWCGRRLFVWRLPARWIFAIFWIVVVYGVLRNIDVYPLTLLAPHTR